jgi:alcohol dehydrogenase class IV
MIFSGFTLSSLPQIHFGNGAVSKLPEILSEYGRKMLVISGKQFFDESSTWVHLRSWMLGENIQWMELVVADEPSPRFIDEAVNEFKAAEIKAVVGIGGGSVLDTAKAVAGLLIPGNSVMDHLEGVGPGLPYQGPSLPFVAVPTTAGTGSEATRNAVLSVRGNNGFKCSFRSNKLAARHALIDPELLTTCPPALIAASGMDAMTQLIESYVSLRSNPMTDSLAIGALERAQGCLWEWYRGGENADLGRNAMAYAAMVSGITLSHAGLGAVHGLASPLGAFFPIPHGVICGTLAGAVAAANIRAMQERDPGNPALAKYAKLGRLLGGRPDLENEPEAALEVLVNSLALLISELKLPRLGELGVQISDISRIVGQSRGSSMKTNPIVLTDHEIEQVLRFRI